MQKWGNDCNCMFFIYFINILLLWLSILIFIMFYHGYYLHYVLKLIHRWTFVFLLGYLLFILAGLYCHVIFKEDSWILNFYLFLVHGSSKIIYCVKESYLRKALDSVPLLFNIINSFENINKNKTKQKVNLNVFHCCLLELFVPVFLFPQCTWNILVFSINLIIFSTFILILYLLSLLLTLWVSWEFQSMNVFALHFQKKVIL